MLAASTQPNDQFGYSVYVLCAYADRYQADQVAAVRKAIKQTRAMIPAHVTVRGTFHSIESLEELSGLLRTTASEQAPTRVQFGQDGWRYLKGKNGLTSALMFCETSPELIALHNAFDAVIRPRSTNAYRDDYSAHLTLCQDCSDEQIEQARSLAANQDLGTGFDIRSVELMGRVGPAFGGEWQLIESIPLGS